MSKTHAAAKINISKKSIKKSIGHNGGSGLTVFSIIRIGDIRR